ncbi:hypothetical protein ACPCSP_01950 [Streptomyces cinereoruber]|uniref:hypothetical protein n=1 Tax=Streptomyces cinereoruber TaxID=67260 RepID=UPI003C2DAB71
MKRGTYAALAGLCGTALLTAMPDELDVDPDSLPEVSCAVYVAVDDAGVVCYVGSVYRPQDAQGLSSHISEYLRDLTKAQRWQGLYVLPLCATTAELEVRRIAGDIAGWLIPYGRTRWPTAS